MLACYVDDGNDDTEGPRSITCSAAYLDGAAGSVQFSRLWRQLLLKHGLKLVSGRDWQSTVESKGWDDEQAQAVLSSFYDAISSEQLLGIAVAIDTRMWQKLRSRMRGLAIGSAEEFAFQRLIRLMLDRLEACGQSTPVTLVFDAEVRHLSRRTGSVRLMYQLERRASNCIPNIQFSYFDRQSHLQAVGLLAHFVRNSLLDGSDSAQHLKSLTALPDASGTPAAAIFEFWDHQYVKKWLDSIEMQAGTPGSAPKRRRSKRKMD